jgi:HEAT repeat protein
VSESTHHLLLVVAWGFLLTFTALALAGVVLLLVIRAVRQATFRRRQQNSAAIRARIVAAMVEEDDEAATADHDLLVLRGLAWHRAEAAMLAMLPKVRGDARGRLLTVLRARGTDRRALKQTRSRRAFVRCQGAFALGVLRSTDAVDRLIGLLDDRSALVRRVAVRSLGQIGDARAAEPLLALANRDLGLTRDLVFALSEFQLDGAPALRAAVRHGIEHYDRSGPLAASVLGMIQDVGAAPALTDAALRGPTALRLAAARALGQLDSPLGVPPLQASLRAPSNQVRVAAATSLGRLGAEIAIPGLIAAVRSPDPGTARAAAAALVDMGPVGRGALERSGLPYAIEALALDRLRRPR